MKWAASWVVGAHRKRGSLAASGKSVHSHAFVVVACTRHWNVVCVVVACLLFSVRGRSKRWDRVASISMSTNDAKFRQRGVVSHW